MDPSAPCRQPLEKDLKRWKPEVPRGGRAPERADGRGRELKMADSPTKITPYRNGPYLIRGPFVMVDQDGNEALAKAIFDLA